MIRCSSTSAVGRCATLRSRRPSTGWSARQASYRAAKRRPRLHDLRHTFAVRALQGSPAGRSRSGAHMVALATYMGHVNIYATYWYLEATADLMRDVAAAGEGFIVRREAIMTPIAPLIEAFLARRSPASGAPVGTRATPMP